MPEESIDKSEVIKNRPRLYYHGAGSPASELLPKIGLLAARDTLTPRLELTAGHLFNTPALTFWYPEKQEIRKSHYSQSQPTVPFTQDLKDKALQDIENSNIDQFFKPDLKRIVNEATTYLPASRLGAIATISESDVGWLQTDLFEGNPRILAEYTTNKDALVQTVKDDLDQCEITFFDPNLNNEVLANDMVRTALEHYLQLIGHNIANAKKGRFPQSPELIQKWLGSLSEVKFEEPNYERYRQALISNLSKLKKD